MNETANMRLIDGSYAGSMNIVARCHLLAHRGWLTARLVKLHDCVAKKCPFLEKAKKEYWQALEKEAQQRKENRAKRKLLSEMQNGRDMLVRETLEDSGHIHVTSIREERRNLLVISYIYDKWIDLAPEIQFLRKKLGMTIKLQARIGSEEAIERLIRIPRSKTRILADVRAAPMVGCNR